MAASSSATHGAASSDIAKSILAEAIWQHGRSPREASKPALPRLRLTELLAQQEITSLLTLIDWAADETVPALAQTLDTSTLFGDHKTYLLFGLTGELGQSLCRWMVKNGARHLVISSRSDCMYETDFLFADFEPETLEQTRS